MLVSLLSIFSSLISFLLSVGILLFESLFNKAYEYKYDPKKFEGIEGLPYSYYPVSPSIEWLLGIIVECNVPQVVDRVISDKEVYAK